MYEISEKVMHLIKEAMKNGNWNFLQKKKLWLSENPEKHSREIHFIHMYL